MLLIFFLVTSSMDIDKGHNRQLPPLKPEEELTDMTDIDEHNILRLQVMAQGRLLCNDQPITIGELKQRVMTFVGKESDIRRHVILLDVARDASYDTYFRVQDRIVNAYYQLRNQMARRQYGHPMAQCTAEQQQTLFRMIPQRIAEVNNSLQTTSLQGQEGGAQ